MKRLTIKHSVCLARIGFASVCLLSGGCAQNVILRSELSKEQLSNWRGGRETVYSKKKNSVIIAPLKNDYKATSRVEFAIAVLNRTRNNLDFSIESIKAYSKKIKKTEQNFNQKTHEEETVKPTRSDLDAKEKIEDSNFSKEEELEEIKELKIYSHNELISEIETKEAINTFLVVLAGAMQAVAASQSGYQNTTVTSSNPYYGTTTYNVQTYNSAIAQANMDKAVSSTADSLGLIKSTSSSAKRQVESYIIKSQTIVPNYWYGGKIIVEMPSYYSLPTQIIFRVKFGNEEHEFDYVYDKKSNIEKASKKGV